MDNQKLSAEEKRAIFDSVQKDIATYDKQRRFRIYTTISAVAGIALLLIVMHSLIYVENGTIQDEAQLSAVLYPNTVDVNQRDIQLILSGNKIITFENDADIKYDEWDESIAESTFNTLVVPKGKRSSLTFVDGTKVWINSGTILRFPPHFSNEKREIWVVGEIYLEVEKDATRAFHVHTPRMMVDVLGTQFNVSAYEEDEEHSVVLVEGSVNVNVNNKKSHLSPNQILSVINDDVSIKKINVYDYISWKEGYLQFSNEPLAAVLIRLSRYYNISVEYDESIAAMECNGKLVLFDEVEEVLTTISNTLPVSFLLEEDRILVQKRY